MRSVITYRINSAFCPGCRKNNVEWTRWKLTVCKSGSNSRQTALPGIWANRAEEKWKFIEPGDVEAAMQTASAIGDDRLQRQAQGYVVPDAFTHGTSGQRTRWFMTGLKSGDVGSCNTFRTEQL